MKDVVIDERLFEEFCRHVSTSINIVEIHYKIDEFKTPDYDFRKDDPIFLAVREPAMTRQLVGFGYQTLLHECIVRLRILPNCRDVYSSELSDDTLEVFRLGFEQCGSAVRVDVLGEKGFHIRCPALVSDILLPVVGRIHGEILSSLDHFTRMLAATGGNPQQLFLNAKSPTPESQYIQVWVATKMNIPFNPGFDTAVVV
jgi:hypothetical protein